MRHQQMALIRPTLFFHKLGSRDLCGPSLFRMEVCAHFFRMCGPVLLPLFRLKRDANNFLSAQCLMNWFVEYKKQAKTVHFGISLKNVKSSTLRIVVIIKGPQLRKIVPSAARRALQSGYKEKKIFYKFFDCLLKFCNLLYSSKTQWSNSQKANFIGFKQGQF